MNEKERNNMLITARKEIMTVKEFVFIGKVNKRLAASEKTRKSLRKIWSLSLRV